MKSHLQFRNEMKTKRLEFERQGANDHKQFSGKWRRPKGLHSKMKVGLRGHPLVPKLGYGSPSDVCGLTRNGLKPFLVFNTKDLGRISSNNIAVISAVVGMKKRLEILSAAKDKKISILGVKDFDQAISDIKKSFEDRKLNKTREKKIEKQAVESKDVKREDQNEPKK